MTTSSHSPAWGLILVRIACGLILFLQGWEQLRDGIQADLILAAQPRFETAPAAYRWLAEHLFLEAPAVFAHILVVGALVCGTGLVLGALTRPAGCLAALGLANAYLAGPPEAQPFVLLLSICCLACALSRAGRYAGIDGSLESTLPGWMTWVKRDRDMFD